MKTTTTKLMIGSYYRNDTTDWLDVVPRTLAFSVIELNTLSNTIEAPKLNLTDFRLLFPPLSRIVDNKFRVIQTEKVTPDKTKPKCDPKNFKRAIRELEKIIGNLTKSVFTYSDTDIITLQYKVRHLSSIMLLIFNVISLTYYHHN